MKILFSVSNEAAFVPEGLLCLFTDAWLFVVGAEVQQRLVDRASGEGGLRGGLHSQPRQAREHPSAAGAAHEAEPAQLQVTELRPSGRR